MTAVVTPSSVLELPPMVPWDSFYNWFTANWKQGEHVTIIGPTGEGKTLLATELIRIPRYVVAFGAKGRDSTLERLVKVEQYMRMEVFSADVGNHIVLWPKIKGAGFAKEQSDAFKRAIDSIYRSGGWTVLLDEVSYFSEFLKLDNHMKFLLNQGRSSGISVVGSTQRPAFIPLAFYGMASHLFFFRDLDRNTAERLAEITGQDRRTAIAQIDSLTKHTFVYVHKHSGLKVRSRVEV